MEFQNEFDVRAPIDEVYAAMLDLERVTPAMPGAEVLEKTDDDHYKVAIKVKVGPITMQYRGSVEVVDKDPEAHSAQLKVSAREARGQGTANADVGLSLDGSGDATHGRMQADVQLAGRAATMGGSVIQDVSAKLVDQFARNLGEMLSSAPAQAEAEAEPDVAQSAASASSPPPARDQARPAPAADGGGVDAVGIAASVAADRLRDPRALLGSLALALVVGWLLGRRSAR